MTRDALRAQIVAAWRPAVYPGDDRICAPTYDDEGVTAYFRGRTWEGHEPASLRYHEVGLSFFTAGAFAYYLAAYMLAVLDDRAAADVVYDGIVFHLSPRQLRKQWGDSYRARIDALSTAQRDATIAYLAWCADGDDSSRPELERTIAYLRDREEPTDASPLARLLELAGESVENADLATLSLSYTTVTDDDLAALRQLPALRELELAGTAIGDAGLAHVGAVSQLRALDLSTCRAITPAGYAQLATLRELETLKLPNTGIDDAGLRALAPLRLRRLDVTNDRALTAAGWAALDASRLERLDMFGVAPSDELLARIGAAGTLRELTARTASDAGLQALARAPLAKLDLGSTDGITARGLAALAALPTLRELQLGGSLSDWPRGWPALEQLTLLDLVLATPLAIGLGALPALRELRIYARSIEPGALAAIAGAPRLDRLTLWASKTPVALDELAGAKLSSLHVHDAEVTGLATLAVPALALSSVVLDVADLAASTVRELALEDVPLDDAQLAMLGAGPLTALRLVRSGVSAAAIAAFRAAHPAIELVEL